MEQVRIGWGGRGVKRQINGCREAKLVLSGNVNNPVEV